MCLAVRGHHIPSPTAWLFYDAPRADHNWRFIRVPVKPGIRVPARPGLLGCLPERRSLRCLPTAASGRVRDRQRRGRKRIWCFAWFAGGVIVHAVSRDDSMHATDEDISEPEHAPDVGVHSTDSAAA